MSTVGIIRTAGDYEELMENIRLLMRRKGIRVKDVADAIHITPDTVSRKLTGRAEFSAKELLDVCNFVGIDVMWRER